MEKNGTHIKAKTGWADIDLGELYQYWDLIYLFVKRNYSTRYKQTILGPLCLIVNPIFTVLLYAFVFGSLAGMSTEGSPQFAFYLCSNAIWSYFALCINQTAGTFTANAAIMGKVYFPKAGDADFLGYNRIARFGCAGGTACGDNLLLCN